MINSSSPTSTIKPIDQLDQLGIVLGGGVGWVGWVGWVTNQLPISSSHVAGSINFNNTPCHGYVKILKKNVSMKEYLKYTIPQKKQT